MHLMFTLKNICLSLSLSKYLNNFLIQILRNKNISSFW